MPFDWMKKSVGLSFHWTSLSARADGTCLPYRQAVERFDVERFVSSVAQSGADHCLFTLTHAEQYLAFPNQPLERLLPGRTAQRDLIGEIADALRQAGIRFLVYYNHSCNGGDDPVWKQACGYAAGKQGDLDAFARNILDIVAFTSRRYGDRISAWWFDSAYSVDPRGPHNTISCELGDWQFPWEELVGAAKSGHEDSAVCINAGIGSNFLYTPSQDYYAGETVDIHERFVPDPVPGVIGHRWTTLDSLAWVFDARAAQRGFAAPRLQRAEAVAFTKDNLARERMTTFNLEIDQTGLINPEALRRFAEIRSAVKS